MDQSQYLPETFAFVLRNYIPEKHKVILLHQRLGKITCMYKKYDRAVRLCTGAQIMCTLEKKQNWYEIMQFDIVFMPEKLSLSQLNFIHNIVTLCLKLLPANITVGELFDFLLYVYQHFDQLTEHGKNIVLLRLFLFFDLLPEDKKIYRCALQDPYAAVEILGQDISSYVDDCWRLFYHEVRQ